MDLTTAILLAWMTACCQEFNVEPAFAKAVCRIESGTKTEAYRFGQLGRSKYAGPFGLHIAYVREKFGVDATDPMMNVLVGVRALRGTQTDQDKIRRLKNYNKTWWKDNYLKDTMATYRRLKREGQ